MPLRFNPSSAMTLGVEIELQILEASTLDLTPGAPRILDEVGDTMPYIKPEEALAVAARRGLISL